MFNNLHNIDVLVVLAYLIFCLILGIVKSKKINSIKEYSLGENVMPATILLATIYATFVGADITMGISEAVYRTGILFAFVQLFTPLFWLFTAKIFGNNVEQFRGCLSLSDI
jgi:Na+/proline symporter